MIPENYMNRPDWPLAGVLADAALDAHEQGFCVVPLEPGHKKPLSEAVNLFGADDAKVRRLTREDVLAYWQRYPLANLGLATGHDFDVLDVDGPTGWESLNRLRRAGLLARPGRVVLTRSGGVHLYYRPSGLGNRANAAIGLDYRGKGGYVVAPPSYVVADDKPPGFYVCVESRSRHEMSTLDWHAVVNYLTPSKPPAERSRREVAGLVGSGDPGRKIAGILAKMRSAVPGERNRLLYWCACRLHEDGSQAALDALLDLEAAALDAGLSQNEVIATIRSAAHAPERSAVDA